MKKTITMLTAILLMLLCTMSAYAEGTLDVDTEIIKAFELIFCVPQGYDSGKPFSYTETPGKGKNGGNGSYYYKLEDGSTAMLTLNVRRREEFDAMTGLHPSMGDRYYLEMAAEMLMNGSPVGMFENEYYEGESCWLLRVRGTSVIGSSFDTFVAYTSNRLYNGTISVPAPGYEEICTAYMDVVLSEIIPARETITAGENMTFNVPHGFYDTDIYEENGVESWDYNYEIDTHYRSLRTACLRTMKREKRICLDVLSRTEKGE